MNIRPINLETELPILRSWWVARGLAPLPDAAFLPGRGYVVEVSGVLVACAWLFIVPGTAGGIGILEFMSTNPKIAVGKSLLSDVKALYAHLEIEAWAAGCGSLISFVAPESGEHHQMQRNGWADLTGGVKHLMLGKVRPCQ